MIRQVISFEVTRVIIAAINIRISKTNTSSVAGSSDEQQMFCIKVV